MHPTRKIIHNSAIVLITGDITTLDVHAIVNAANSHLILGAGVAGAIRKRGGPAIQAECDAIGGTPVGTAVITGGGHLPARHVIHAVGPVMGSGNEAEKLAAATRNALSLADANHLPDIAFPAISTGVFGVPRALCARVMLDTARTYLMGETGLNEVIFCLFDDETHAVFEQELHRLNPGKSP